MVCLLVCYTAAVAAVCCVCRASIFRPQSVFDPKRFTRTQLLSRVTCVARTNNTHAHMHTRNAGRSGQTKLSSVPACVCVYLNGVYTREIAHSIIVSQTHTHTYTCSDIRVRRLCQKQHNTLAPTPTITSVTGQRRGLAATRAQRMRALLKYAHTGRTGRTSLTCTHARTHTHVELSG